MTKKSESLTEPAVPNAVSRFVESMRAEAEGALEHVRGFEVVDIDGRVRADRVLNKIAVARDEWDAERKSFVEPLKTTARRIDAAFKLILSPLDEAEGILKAKLGAFELGERKKREALIVAAAEAARAGKAEEAEALVIAATMPVAEDVDSKSATRIEWAGEVIDAEAIPRQYLIPDVAALRALTKAAGRDPGIQGWKAYEVAVVRTSRR